MSEKLKANNIPIAIAKYLALPDAEYFNIYDKFAYLIKSADGDSYYLCNFLVEEGLITEDLGVKLYELINASVSYEDIFGWYKEWS